MNLTIDDTGKNMQAFGIDDAASTRGGNIAKGGNAAIGYGKIGHAFASVADDGRALKDKIEGISQVSVRLQGGTRSHTSQVP